MSSKESKPKKNVFFLVFVAILPIVTLFSSLANNQPANALWGDDIQSNTKGTEVFDRISSVAYYTALSNCMDKGWGLGIDAPQIEISKLKAGEWVYIDDAVPIGVFMRDSAISNSESTDINNAIKSNDWDGKVQCNNKQLIKGALKLWGLANKEIEVLCNSGWKNKGGSIPGEGNNFEQTAEDCIKLSSTDQGENILWFTGGNKTHTPGSSLFKDYIKRTVFGNSLKTAFADLSLVDQYVFYRHSLSQSCLKGLDSTAPQTTASVDSSIGYNNLKWISFPSGDVVTGSMLVSKDWRPIGRSLNLAPLVANSTCPKAVDAMNKLVNDTDLVNIIKSANQTGNGITATQDTAYNTGTVANTCGNQAGSMAWIGCPIISTLTSFVDGAWDLLQGLFKSPALQAKDSNNNDTVAYQTWVIIRNISNVLFVIVFLITIFSQITNIGISNYEIKKILPKLIIGAILVNLSFFLMQIIFDLTNIVGSGLYDLLTNTISGGTSNNNSVLGGIASDLLTLALGGAGVGIGIAAAGGITASIWLLLPILAGAALALLAAIFTLMFRLAVIPILAILAPLAFVLYLLPNTTSLFKKWKDILVSMLMLYPLAALLFGGAQVASKIFAGDSGFIGRIISMVVLVLPLGALPFLAKKSGAIVGAVGGALNGLAGKAKKPIGDFTGDKKDTAKSRREAELLGSTGGGITGLRRKAIQGRIARQSSKSSAENNLKLAQSKNLAERLKTDPNFLKQYAGKDQSDQERARNRAISTLDQLEEGEMKEAIASMNNNHLNPTTAVGELQTELSNALISGDTMKARAARSVLSTKGGAGLNAIHNAIDVAENRTAATGGINSETKTALQSDIAASGIKSKDAILHKWSSSTSTLDSLSHITGTHDGLSDEEMASQSEISLNAAINSGSLTPEKAYRIVHSQNGRLLGSAGAAERAIIEKHASRYTPTP
jgi:hypothetical protein